MSSAKYPLRDGDRVWRVGVINGSNMSNLINRDPTRKGPPLSIDALEQWIVAKGKQLGLEVTAMHSNYGGAILEWIHEHCYGGKFDGVLINPAGFTTYGEHVRDALHESCLPY